MLKTNSKQARENVRAYIMKQARGTAEERADYIPTCPRPDTDTFEGVAFVIGEAFRREYGHEIKRIGYARAFEEWGQALAFGGLFTHYLENAVDILGDILEETAEERSRYSEEKAEHLLTYLIGREVEKANG